PRRDARQGQRPGGAAARHPRPGDRPRRPGSRRGGDGDRQGSARDPRPRGLARRRAEEDSDLPARLDLAAMGSNVNWARRRATYANVAVTAALVLAMSGAGYAAPERDSGTTANHAASAAKKKKAKPGPPGPQGPQ